MALVCKAIVEAELDVRLLMIDADPAKGLAYALGIDVGQTIGDIRNSLIETARVGESEETERAVKSLDAAILDAIHEAQGFALLAMGRSEARGCFCPVNNLLRTAIDTLIDDFDVILIDAEAGLEQISRQVIDRIDTLLVLSDGSLRSLETADQIFEMVDERAIECAHVGLVFNRARGDWTRSVGELPERTRDVLGFVPEDELVAEFDRGGRPLLDLVASGPAPTAVREIVLTHILARRA